MSTRQHVSRRTFLKGAAAAAGAVAAPCVLSSSALGLDGAVAPSNRIIYGYVGCGNHGAGWNFDQVFRYADAQIIAVCDVDQSHVQYAKKRVDGHYSQRFGKDYKACTMYGDFRDLINRRDLDVVGIATPDHWHVIPAIMAAKAGKDVIGEKPMTLTVAEGRILSNVMKQTGRIFQTASENRSIDAYIRLIELVRGGVIGKLKHIEVRLPIGNGTGRVGGDARELANYRTPQDPPKELNYEMWLGQAPWMPYIPARSHGNFRWNLAFSGGVLTDWGAHMVDLAQWGHNTEHTGPVEVEGKGDFPPRNAVYNTAPTFEIHYKYADGVTMTVSAGAGRSRSEKEPRGTGGGPNARAGHPLRGHRRVDRIARLARLAQGQPPPHARRGDRPGKSENLSPQRNRRPHRGRQRGRAPQLYRLRQVAQALLCPGRNRPPHDHHPAHRQHRHAAGPQAAVEPRGRAIRRRRRGRQDAQPQAARTVDHRQHRLLDKERRLN